MPATESMRSFAEVLRRCWTIVQKYNEEISSGSFQVDWLQANWELIVEGSVCYPHESLEVYGDGADCNGGSSRVVYPDRLPTHKIACRSSTSSRVYDYLGKRYVDDLGEGYIDFDRLVASDGRQWFLEKPPFDMVLGFHAGEKVVVSFDAVDFYALKI